jgi:hypothetical protein
VGRRACGTLVAAATLTVAWSLTTTSVAGQAATFERKSVCPDDDPAAFHRCALAAGKTFTPPRTADGRPDMSGYWRRRTQAFEDLEAHPRNADDGGGPSVVVDPPDGRVPMQPWADVRRRENAAKYLHHNAACLPAGAVPTMYMANLYQFLQTRDVFAIVGEGLSEHPYRLIPLDRSAPAGSRLQFYQGDSRGRWEGNTLIIETTNQNAKQFLDQRGRFYTDEMRAVERLTMVDANTLHFQAVIDDPNVFTRAFTIAYAFRRNTDPTAEVWEEACFEANAEQMQLFRNNGFQVYPGITAAEARVLRQAWEAQGAAR